MPGTRLATSDRPGFVQERRNAGIEDRRILGKSKERWVLRELGQSGLLSTVRKATLGTQLLSKDVH
jgi:hypothetical protein